MDHGTECLSSLCLEALGARDKHLIFSQMQHLDNLENRLLPWNS